MILNSEQEKAVFYTGEKPLLIEAGPGAGKTRVIIERIKFLYNDLKVDPSSIVVITFSRKAADELMDRLTNDDIPSEDVAMMNISTIHSFCFSLLSGETALEVISDDNNERLDLFIRDHLDELGFSGIATLKSKGEISRIIEKFDEYTIFDVDSENLASYIKNNNPISDEFISLVESCDEFPRDDVKDSFKDDWYNARYCQVAKAYPIFVKLLEDNGYIDFSSIQKRALEYLNTNPSLPFKHILVDEFQDTDVVQFSIFKKLLESCESFTAVGDVDQSIYGFRGANDNYFRVMLDSYDCELVNLNSNYRSSNEVIGLSEDYISYQRRDNSSKSAVGVRDVSKPSFYMKSSDKHEEASRIADVIVHLKESGKVKNYSDIAVLTRSVKSNIPFLIDELRELGVPYQVKGLNDFVESNEVKSIIATLYAIIPISKKAYIRSRWESEWLDLRTFTDESFVIHEFSDKSRKVLNDTQDKFEEELIECEKEVYKEFTGKTSRIKKVSGVFNRDEDILEEIFKRVEKPDILRLKFEDEDDENFISLLNEYRKELFFDNDTESSLTILNLYYNILNYGGFLKPEYVQNPKNQSILNDLAQLSETIHNYGEMISKRDLRGLYWFLSSKLNDYSRYTSDNEDAVAIMTVHKSKGLEFPVVIISSLEEGKFPTTYRNEEEKRYIAGRPNFYTPDECLELKDNKTLEEKTNIHYEEEDRVIYVAMTRAQDTLILSTINEIPIKIQNLIDKNQNFHELTDNKQLEVVECEEKKIEEENPTINYTKLKDYQQCPYKFYILHKLNFKSPMDEKIDTGVLVHKIFQHLNTEMLKGEEITRNKIRKVTETILKKQEDVIEETYENVVNYYENEAKDMKIIASELPFILKRDNITIKGIIDLVYEKNGKLGILDYKNTKFNPMNLKSYKEQLHLYALNTHPKFEKGNIEELKVYAVKSREMINVDMDDEITEELKEKIDETSLNILKERFDKNEENCSNCTLSFICNSNHC